MDGIRTGRQKGMSFAEIARKYYLDLRIAKKYAMSEIKLVYKLTQPKPSKLDPYKQQINVWLEERHTARHGYWKSSMIWASGNTYSGLFSISCL